jgi:hypothetical protein
MGDVEMFEPTERTTFSFTPPINGGSRRSLCCGKSNEHCSLAMPFDLLLTETKLVFRNVEYEQNRNIFLFCQCPPRAIISTSFFFSFHSRHVHTLRCPTGLGWKRACFDGQTVDDRNDM